jgi:hypothetical protein
VDGWLDLTHLVASSGNSKKSAYDDLAYSIGAHTSASEGAAIRINPQHACATTSPDTTPGAGKDVYVDLSGWHLFLRDMTASPGLKMNHALAQQLGPQVSSPLPHASPVSVFSLLAPQRLGPRVQEPQLALRLV